MANLSPFLILKKSIEYSNILANFEATPALTPSFPSVSESEPSIDAATVLLLIVVGLRFS